MTAAPTIDQIEAKKKADAKNAEKIKKEDAAAAAKNAAAEEGNGREENTLN